MEGNIRNAFPEKVTFELLSKMSRHFLNKRTEPAKPAQAPAVKETVDTEKVAPEGKDRPVVAKAKAALDKLTNLKAKFEERIKARETDKTQPRMTELEQRRYEDVQSLHKAISELTDKRSAAHDAYLSDLLDFAKQTERPYTKADLEFSGDPNKPSVDMTRALQTHD